MSSCACSPAARTTVTFAHGVVLERCPRHEQQSWTIDGRPTAHAEVLRVLKDLFTAERGRRASGVLPARRRTVVDLNEPRPAAPVAEPAATPWADDQLTELLNARGLQGSWAVA